MLSIYEISYYKIWIKKIVECYTKNLRPKYEILYNIPQLFYPKFVTQDLVN